MGVGYQGPAELPVRFDPATLQISCSILDVWATLLKKQLSFFICVKIISSFVNYHIVLQIFELMNKFILFFYCVVGFVECINKIIILTLFRMGFIGATHGWGGGGDKKAPPSQNQPRISYNDETWHSYILPKEDPKNI